MKRRVTNQTAYLFGNLVILCLILLALWRGQPGFDLVLRLPSLLLILVILNTVLIFREGFPSRHGSESRSTGTLSSLRRALADRPEPDGNLLPEALNALLGQSGHQALALHFLEEGGAFSLQSAVGSLPRQLSGLKWVQRNGDLILRHPGNLGEEAILGWANAWNHRVFRSQITRLDLILVPLHLLGKRKGLLAIVPGRSRAARSAAALETVAVFLEGVIAVHLTQTLIGNGRFVDARTGLLRYDGFMEAFETEVERSERYSQNMTLLNLSLIPFEGLAEPVREGLTKALVGALRTSLRRLDQMFSGKSPGGFIAILTETNEEVARLVTGRIQAAFQKQVQGKEPLKGSQVRLCIGTATYPSDATHGAGILEKAEEALAAAASRDVPVVAYSSLAHEGSKT